MSSKNFDFSRYLYKIHLLMMFHLRGTQLQFRHFLATNVLEADDFDDVIMKYLYRDGNGINKCKIVLLQAIHRDNSEKYLTFKQLISKADRGQFSLKKYFKSYRKIKRNFAGGKSDWIFGYQFNELDIVMYTNSLTDFSNKIDSVDKVDVKRDDILNFNLKECGYYYKIKTSGEYYRRIVGVLEYCSDCKKLARALTKSIFSVVGVALNEGILRNYHVPLKRDVIKVESEGKSCLRKSFLNSDCEFKKAFLEEVQKQTEFTGKSEDELILELQSKSFTLSDVFGKRTNMISGNYPEFLPQDLVSEFEINEFLDRLRLFVEQPDEEKFAVIIKDNIQKMYDVVQEDIQSIFGEIRMTMLHRTLQWQEETNYITERSRIFKDLIRVSIRFDIKNPLALFTGRDEDLKKLHEILQNGSQANISQTVCVIGLGGIGKSELARKYISEYYNYYDDNIIWIKAENYSTISESFLRLAEERLNISTKNRKGMDRNVEDIVSDVYAFFANRHRKSLFVFDNAVTDGCISKFLPYGLYKPHVLITTRNQEWGNIKSISLDVLTREASTKFIKEALKYDVEMKDDEVNRLVEATGDLPLALGHAVTYIKMRNRSSSRSWKSKMFRIGNYLEMLEKNTEELLMRELSDSRDRYSETILTTWTTTLNRIEKDVYGKLALEIFDVIAYLASDNIPVEQIFLTLNISEMELHGAVELLDQHSLASLERGQLNIHRLVQKVTRIHLEKQGKDKFVIQKTWNLLKKCFPLGNNESDAQTQKIILPHLEALLHHTQSWILNKPQDLQILGNQIILSLGDCMAIGYNNTDNSKRLKEILEIVLLVKEQLYGTDHCGVSRILTDLGSAYDGLGNSQNVIETLDKALHVKDKSYSTEHFIVAETLNKIDSEHVEQIGNHQKQTKLLEPSLGTDEKCYESNDFEVVTLLNNLGSAYGDLVNSLENNKC